jgi:hypothetical protein
LSSIFSAMCDAESGIIFPVLRLSTTRNIPWSALRKATCSSHYPCAGPWSSPLSRGGENIVLQWDGYQAIESNALTSQSGFVLELLSREGGEMKSFTDYEIAHKLRESTEHYPYVRPWKLGTTTSAKRDFCPSGL